MDPLARVLDESSDRGNPSPEEMREMLARIRVIGVVGISRDPKKAARRVPSYLSTKGYDIVPVNPFAERILGRPVRRELDAVAEPLDMVLIFRPSGEAGLVLRQAAARPERPVIWLQEGIVASDEAAVARASGLTVVQDLCLFKVHRAAGEQLPRPVAR